MATFTTIADTVLEPGKPIRSVDTLALRDNPIAIAGGAAGAPRIVTNAIQNANVTTAKLATNERMTTANVLSATAGASAGNVGSYSFLRADSATSNNETKAGSALRFSDSAGNTGDRPAGTWRCMAITLGTNRASVFLRIS